MNNVFKLGPIVVLLLTLAAPPAGAQGDDAGLGRGLTAIVVVGVLAFFGVSTLVAVGLDYAIPDAPVKLVEERVEINLAPAKVSVSAEYVFQNDAEEDKKLELTYPFGRGRGVGPAENVAVSEGAGVEIPFARKNKNAAFALTIAPKGEAKVFVVYEQPLGGTAFTYLLGKDRFWGLVGADTTFVVTAPPAMGDVSSVYPLKKIAGEEEGSSRYEYKRKNFHPRTNFTITWEKSPAATP